MVFLKIDAVMAIKDIEQKTNIDVKAVECLPQICQWESHGFGQL